MASTNDALLAVNSSGDELEFFKRRGLRFRVLILGRANAGKTTILERITGASAAEAQVWRDGELLEGQVSSTNHHNSCRCSVVDLKIVKGQSDVCVSFHPAHGI